MFIVHHHRHFNLYCILLNTTYGHVWLFKMGKSDLKSQIRNGDIFESASNVRENTLFAKCGCICEKAVTSDYILNVDTTKDSTPSIAVSTAQKSCLIYSLDNSQVAKIWEYDKYNAKIIDCRFSNGDKNLLYTATSDGCIRVLDLRAPQNFAINFEDTTVTNGSNKTFNCFDMSSNDRLLAAGTDVFGGDAYILFWDTRNKKLLGSYWECHVDDITQVRFHPDDMNKLVSGSTDGLINVYDLSQTCEDDALVDTLNTESSVSELSWFYTNKKYCLSCITHTFDVQLWDMDNGEPYKTFSRAELAGEMMDCCKDFYVANCHETKNGLLVLGGSPSNEECFRAANIKKDKMTSYVEFSNNKQTITDSSFNKNNNILVTGGEKGILNIWKVSF